MKTFHLTTFCLNVYLYQRATTIHTTNSTVHSFLLADDAAFFSFFSNIKSLNRFIQLAIISKIVKKISLLYHIHTHTHTNTLNVLIKRL